MKQAFSFRARLVMTLMLVLSLHFVQAQWRVINENISQNQGVINTSFYSPSSGYLAGKRWVGFTSDSGYTFLKRELLLTDIDYGTYPVNLLFPFEISDIKAFSKDTLLVSGNLGWEPTILHSTNGGLNWKVVFHRSIQFGATSANSMYQLAFPGNGNIGYAVHNDQIIKTTDRGKTWIATLSVLNIGLTGLSFVNDNVGAAYGLHRLYSTTNGFTNWTQHLNIPTLITSFSVISDQKFFANTYDGDTYYSINRASTWTKANTDVSRQTATKIHFVNDSVGYAARSYIYKTRNRGKNWEPMEGSVEPIGPYMTLQIMDNQLAWAAGGKLAITTNGGGATLPQALFEANTNTVCTDSVVQLINHGRSDYSYQWFKNDIVFANTFNASFKIGSTPVIIKLVVSNGTATDTMSIPVSVVLPPPIGLSAAVREDTVCSGTPFYIDVFNSKPDVYYRMTTSFEYTAVPGNGGTLTFQVGTGGYGNFSGNLNVVAYKNLDCGRQNDTVSIPVRTIDPRPVSTPIVDTLCTQGIFYIRVANSRPEYEYWSDPTLPKVTGTGGTILLPCKESLALSTYPGVMTRYDFPVNIRHLSLLCEGGLSARAEIWTRRASPLFDINGYEWFTNEVLSFTNTSTQAVSYTWKFPDGGNPPTSNEAVPSNVRYTTAGFKKIQLSAYTKEGCVDSSNRVIEVFNKIEDVPQTAICNSTGSGNAVDSIKAPFFYRNRDLFEDEYGNRIMTGAVSPMSMSYADNDGWFARKYDKNGQMLWSLEQTPGNSAIETWLSDTHIIMESVIGDSLGYTYLFGHSANYDSIIVAGQPHYDIRSKWCSFLLKISPTGRILWVKNFYNKAWTYEEMMKDFTSGSLLRGKNGDVYLVTQRFPGNRFFMDDQLLYTWNDPKGAGVILHFDQNGNLLRKKNFPVQYNNLRPQMAEFSGKFDQMPRPIWDSTGRIVLYSKINVEELSFYIDDVLITDEMVSIRSALMFVDTSSFRINAVKLVARNTAQGRVGVNVESFAVDAAGNYYAGYSRGIPNPFNPLDQPTFKAKSYISRFAANGDLQWVKQSEGLQPNGINVWNNELKVAGTNYTYPGFTAQAGYYGNYNGVVYSPLGKLTAVGDTSSFDVRGTYGLGSRDFPVATLQTSDGKLKDLRFIGSSIHDESPILRKGYGNHYWITGTVGLTIIPRDTSTTLYSYKLPWNNDCNTNYRNEPAFVKLDLVPATLACTDSLYHLRWSSRSVNLVNLSFSKDNGATFTSLANGIQASSQTFSFNALQKNVTGNIVFRIQDDASGLSDTVTVAVHAWVVPEVTITSPATTVCQGQKLQATATSVNGGIDPTYRWLVDDNVVVSGFTGPTVELTVGQYYRTLKVVMTSNAICAKPLADTSNILPISVISPAAPDVTISGPVNTICEGVNTTFTAIATNAGLSPIYQWQVNEVNAGTNSNTFTSSSLHGGDKIRVIITRSITTCAVVNKDTSNTISANILPLSTPAVSLAGATVVPPATSSLITAAVTGVTFIRWEDSTAAHTWQDINSAAFQTYIYYLPPATGVKLRARVTSTYQCAIPAEAVSQPLTFTVGIPTSVNPVPALTYGVRMYPNPSTNVITIDSLRITDKWETIEIISTDGKSVLISRNVVNQTKVTIGIDQLTSGIYMVVLRRGIKEPVYWKLFKY